MLRCNVRLTTPMFFILMMNYTNDVGIHDDFIASIIDILRHCIKLS